MKILHLASECVPFAKAGGLGDVLGALPDALAAARPEAEVTTILPLYQKASAALQRLELDVEDTGVFADVQLGETRALVRFLRLARPGRATVIFAACDAAFQREGLYGYDDDGLRFILFCKAVVGMAGKLLGGPPDIVHAHDWHAALAPALIATSARHMYPKTHTVLSLHNLAYQGVLDKELMPLSGLGWEQFTMECAEWYDHINLLKAGISLADAVTTVSPTYAREIRTPEFGCELDGFLRRFPVHGILNGIDDAVWNPEEDPHVRGSWTAEDLSGKAEARAALLELCEWEDKPDVPILGIVSRMTAQKGLDLVARLVPELHDMPARLVVLGTGEPGLESAFREAARIYTHNVRADISFNEPLSHEVIAGSDMLLVPSRFEPCGLTQMYAMRMGTVPVVHRTGGLADTVRDYHTGFVFDHATVEGLRWALQRAVDTFRHRRSHWEQIQKHGMNTDWSWAPSARRYLGLYDALTSTGRQRARRKV